MIERHLNTNEHFNSSSSSSSSKRKKSELKPVSFFKAVQNFFSQKLFVYTLSIIFMYIITFGDITQNPQLPPVEF